MRYRPSRAVRSRAATPGSGLVGGDWHKRSIGADTSTRSGPPGSGGAGTVLGATSAYAIDMLLQPRTS
ncbi:hypothetical protein FVP47_20345, partial [Mycobacterium tuberculosis]|nr:hypothetical protein [Mycobacterium tuberculosis]